MAIIDEEQLRKSYKQAAIIAGALIYGCVMILGIFYWLMRNGTVVPSGDFSLYRQLAVVLGGASLVGSFYMRKVVLQKKETGNFAQQVSVFTLAKRLTTAMLVSMAMVEGAVFFGIVLAYQSRNLQDLLVPLIVGAIGFAVHFPRYQEWETWVREQ